MSNTENNIATLNPDDLITVPEEQIKHLLDLGLEVTSPAKLRHIINNYGFNNLFRKYSSPFLQTIDNKTKYLPNVTEQTILELYYFDSKFSNILMVFLRAVEIKFTANIIDELNEECPDARQQLAFLYPKLKDPSLTPEQKEKLIAKLANLAISFSEEGSDYLKPFVKAGIYPGWIILGEMTLGDKANMYNKIKHIDTLLENFYLIKNKYKNEFKRKDVYRIFFNFIRPFRNICAHFDRLLKFFVNLTDYENNLYTKLISNIITNENYLNQILKQKNRIYSFGIIIVIIYLLGKYNATVFTKELISFIEESQANNKFYDTNAFLTNPKIYNWPIEWKNILLHAIENKTK